MGYLWVRFGDPLLFYSAQESWGRQATGPLDTASRAWGTAVEGAGRLLDSGLWADPSPGNVANHLAGAGNFFNLAFFVFAMVVLLAGLRDLPLSLTVYGLLLVAPATLFGTPGSPLMGTPRYVLVAFPVFIVLAPPVQEQGAPRRMAGREHPRIPRTVRTFRKLALRRVKQRQHRVSFSS